MVVIIIARELLVTTIRATLESQGIEFAAVGAGKAKMILQAVAVPVLLAAVWVGTDQPWVRWTRDIMVWAVVVVTILSGLPYISGALKAVKGAHRDQG